MSPRALLRMIFLSVLFALILEHYLTWHRRDRMVDPFLRWAALLRRFLDAGTAGLGLLAWLLAVIPVFLLGIAAHYVALSAGGAALAWLIDVLALGAVIDFKGLSDRLNTIGGLLRAEQFDAAQEAIEAWEGAPLPGEFDAPGLASRALQLALLHAHWRVLAPILWFVVLPGCSGPLVYAASLTLRRRWAPAGNAEGTGSSGSVGLGRDAFGNWARAAQRTLDWLPARLSALSFAVVGNFEESLHCWRTQNLQNPTDPARIVLAAGAGALGVHFEPAPALPFGVTDGDLGTGDFPGVEHLQNMEGLLARTLVFAVVVLGVMTVGGLLSF